MAAKAGRSCFSKEKLPIERDRKEDRVPIEKAAKDAVRIDLAEGWKFVSQQLTFVCQLLELVPLGLIRRS